MLMLVAVVLGASDGGCAPPECRTFPSAKAAFVEVLKAKPAVLAIGEYHEQEGAPKARSALSRFTKELLPSLRGRAGGLVVETWMTTGKCGVVEKQAVAEVKTVTQRPDTTEDELTVLLERSHALGLKNHILLVSCDDYRSMLKADGSLDALKSLELVRRLMEAKALEALEKGEGPLVLYGGAIHNDVKPLEDYAEYSYGPSLASSIDGGYEELDLIVPEHGETDDDLPKEWWWPWAAKQAAAGRVALIQPNVHSSFLVFPRSGRRSR